MRSKRDFSLQSHCSGEPFDLVMVCGHKDIKLARHFFDSYRIFFRSPGSLFLWIWKKHEHLLRQIDVPNNLILLYKDDIPELTEDDYKNQMYLKLISHRYVETDWYWVPDTDYLIVSPLSKDHFFSNGRPYWYFCKWWELAERTFRKGSEFIYNKRIESQFLIEQQFVHNKTISAELEKRFNLRKILDNDHLSAEQIVYGCFAYEYFNKLYAWVNLDESDDLPISYKVNQRPPSFCELDPSVNLVDLPQAKYYVFWSQWEQAENKMVEFILDAQLKEFGEVLLEPNRSDLYPDWTLDDICKQKFWNLEGIYSDGWLQNKVCFSVTTDSPCILEMFMDVPVANNGYSTDLKVKCFINEKKIETFLKIGRNSLKLFLKTGHPNNIKIEFSGGFLEPGGNRHLFARLVESGIHLSTEST